MPIKARLRGHSFDLGILADLLREVNGAARLMTSNFRPVELDGHFSDPAGNTHAVVLPETAHVRVPAGAVTIHGGQPSQQPEPVAPAPRYVQLADAYTEVGDVLALFGKPDPALDWFDLYKIYEIVGYQVADGRRGRQPALTATGLVTRADLDAFTASANHQGVSGDAARHARQSGPAPKHTMTIEDARRMIRALVTRWLDSL